MAELDQVLQAVCTSLENSDISVAIQRYPLEMRKRYTTPVITVGLKSGVGTTPGFAEYIGQRYVQESDQYIEVYGKRLELTLCLNIYAPKSEANGAGKCMELFGKVLTTLNTLPSGLRIRSVTCGETEFDHSANLFCCPCEVKLTAFLYAETTEDIGEFLDFILKGVLVE